MTSKDFAVALLSVSMSAAAPLLAITPAHAYAESMLDSAIVEEDLGAEATRSQISSSQALPAGVRWTNSLKRTSGSWAFVQKADGLYVALGENFKTRNAPDLKLYLSTKDAASRTDSNGLEGTLFIADLASNKGAQSYKLPAEVDLDDFVSLMIYCEQYSKFWAAVDLN